MKATELIKILASAVANNHDAEAVLMAPDGEGGYTADINASVDDNNDVEIYVVAGWKHYGAEDKT